MSTFKYYSASSAFGTQQINWLTDNIGALLVLGGYSPSQAHDQFVADIPSASILVRSGHLTSKAITNGVCKGTIPEFLALVSLALVVGLVLYKDTGDDTTSQLIYYSSDGIGFPFTAAGINYFVAFDQTQGGWFQL